VGIELKATLKARKLLIRLNAKDAKNGEYAQVRYTAGTPDFRAKWSDHRGLSGRSGKKDGFWNSVWALVFGFYSGLYCAAILVHKRIYLVNGPPLGIHAINVNGAAFRYNPTRAEVHNIDTALI
jgi:hypothetical protein